MAGASRQVILADISGEDIITLFPGQVIAA
jgi:hypothetical protein